MATVAAPLMPLMAAKKVQMTMVPMARPPLIPPTHLYIISYRASAIPECCNRMPMKTNRGMATRMKLFMTPKAVEEVMISAAGPINTQVKMTDRPPRM